MRSKLLRDVAIVPAEIVTPPESAIGLFAEGVLNKTFLPSTFIVFVVFVRLAARIPDAPKNTVQPFRLVVIFTFGMLALVALVPEPIGPTAMYTCPKFEPSEEAPRVTPASKVMNPPVVSVL